MLAFIKQSLKSKTVLLNVALGVAQAAIAVSDIALGTDIIKNNLDLVKVVVGLQTAANIVLRFLTTVPVSEK